MLPIKVHTLGRKEHQLSISCSACIVGNFSKGFIVPINLSGTIDAKLTSMLATMERLPFTQPFQHGQNSSSPLQSPRTGLVAFPVGSYGLPSPDRQHYSISATTAARATSSCLPTVQSPQAQYQNEIVDPSSQLYPNSSTSAMIPHTTSSLPIACHKHEPTCSQTSCSQILAAGSPPMAVTPGTPQQHIGMESSIFNDVVLDN